MQHFVSLFISIALLSMLPYQETLYATDDSTEPPLDKHRLCLQNMVNVARWYCPEVGKIIARNYQELCESKKNTPFNDYDYLNFTMNAQINTSQYPDEMHGILNLNTYYFSNNSMVLIPSDLTSQSQHHFIISPGYSHQRIDSLQQLFLERICELTNTRETLIQIADVGAGHGYTSRNALIAGGKHASSSRHSTKPLRGAHIYAIEQHPPLTRTEQGDHGPLMFAFRDAKKYHRALIKRMR